jgi:hypothetical protein
MPPGLRDLLGVEVWWLILLVAALAALLVAGRLLRAAWRALLAPWKRKADWSQDRREVLEECPLPRRPPGENVLTVYHVPVRLRLVVVAPAGKEAVVDATAVEKLLDRLVPGLGAVAKQDRPRIRVWPPQLSTAGFTNSFHRCTVKPEPEEQPSRWILAAGRGVAGRLPVLLGVGLWAEQPSTLGRINLEPHQWLDVLRLRPVGK